MTASAYMRWSKDHAPARFDLSGSNLLHCSIDDLPGARDALQLTGLNADGWPPLLEAIADRYGTTPDRVATASGAGGANFLVLAALVRPGDRVVVERPAYDPMLGALRLLGADIARFDRSFEDGWRIDPDRVAAVVDDQTRLIVLTSPHNPTGVRASDDEIDVVADIAARHGARVLIDEVYLDIAVLPDRARPAAARSDEIISTSSLTKSYGLNGLRAGWVIAHPEIVQRVQRTRDVMDGIGPVPMDRLAVVAFQHLDALADRARWIVSANRAHVDAFLAARTELDFVEPASTVVFPRIRGVPDAGPFVQQLRERFDTQVVPGAFFDTPAHFRIAFAGERETLEGGLDALSSALDELPRP